MNRLAVIIALLLASAAEALACPGCMYERMLLSNWLPKVFALKVAAAVIVTAWRLDLVRVLYTFLAYVFAYDYVYRYAIAFSFPGGNPIIGGLGTAGVIVLAVGALDVGLLLLMSRLRFYRRKQETGLAWWHPAVYLACIWTIWPMIA